MRDNVVVETIQEGQWYARAHISHGGTAVSAFLRDQLADIVESVTPADVPAAVEATEELGGYFRRWRGGALQRWTKWASGSPAEAGKDRFTLEERLTLAFLKVSDMAAVNPVVEHVC